MPTIVLRARIRPHTRREVDIREIWSEASDPAEAFEALMDQVPPGWHVLRLLVEGADAV